MAEAITRFTVREWRFQLARQIGQSASFSNGTTSAYSVGNRPLVLKKTCGPFLTVLGMLGPGQEFKRQTRSREKINSCFHDCNISSPELGRHASFTHSGEVRE